MQLWHTVRQILKDVNCLVSFTQNTKIPVPVHLPTQNHTRNIMQEKCKLH